MEQQRGIALAATLILLTAVTLLGLYAASNSSLGLFMAKNMQDAFDAFQSAEAGVAAVVGMPQVGTDPFTGTSNSNPLGSYSTILLQELNRGAGSVDTSIELKLRNATCPRSELASSTSLISCDHYRVVAVQESDDARATVAQGVVKSVIGGAGP